MIALDLDGTLLDYSPEGERPAVNWWALNELQRRGVRRAAFLTNQGGICFGVMGSLRKNGLPYPTPKQFYVRLGVAISALAQRRINVDAVRVSCWHPAAQTQPEVAAAVQKAAQEVRGLLAPLHWVEWCVYTTARARKPEPLMLRSVGATEYWGDSPEDGGAARAAGVPFVKVDRFFG